MDAAQLTNSVNTVIDQHAFSGVIDIRQHNTVLYARAAGYADRSNKIPNTLDTRFGSASGTKFFTALAIGKLIAAKQLSFSTKLHDCVALDFPRYSSEITIRHLLTHTSGIPDYFDEETITDDDPFPLSTPSYALHGPRDYLAVFPDAAMQFVPGERFAYSNGGYILLGVVIEELTGMRYQDFVEQTIFQAIGMQQSGYFALNQLPEHTALGYLEGDGGGAQISTICRSLGRPTAARLPPCAIWRPYGRPFGGGTSCPAPWLRSIPRPLSTPKRRVSISIMGMGCGLARTRVAHVRCTSWG